MELAAQAAFLGRKAHTVAHGLSDICKNIRVKPKSLGQCECENAPALPRTLKSRPTVYPSPSEWLPVLKLRNRCAIRPRLSALRPTLVSPSPTPTQAAATIGNPVQVNDVQIWELAVMTKAKLDSVNLLQKEPGRYAMSADSDPSRWNR